MKGNNMTNLMQTLSSQMNMSPSDLLNFNNKNIVSENDMKELQLDINSAKNSMFSKEPPVYGTVPVYLFVLFIGRLSHSVHPHRCRRI